MGRVYEALDPRLNRQVAVKVMHRNDARTARRFLREARAQAAVSHPGVCPVFEAGEVEGTPYIAMLRIHGRPLLEAAASLPIEDKLRVMRQVAEAVHAAHLTGLVHRDLKPGNILVESTPEGVHHAYVLDFGLARLDRDEKLTADGALLGTPAYMAPEQVRGDDTALGPRTDVYALGATLYFVLAGRAPFAGDSASALHQILTREPPALRSLRVPAEVEAITFKCLEKEPDQRYASAQALAEDLGRFLEGRPVLARPAGWWYRLRKRARRHATLVAVTGALSALLIAALIWASVSTWRGRARERFARTFTQQVEQIEARARYSHLSPLHDIRSDRALLEQRMEAIREEMNRAGRLARAGGYYALGRGHLALEELESAHHYLDLAWEAGQRGPEEAAAMAQTLSALYREELAATELVKDWESRQQRLENLERTYGQPALGFLEQSLSSNPEEQPFLAALVPFHENRFEQALEALRTSRGKHPWSYELHQLEGDIRRTWAARHAAEGEREEALAELRRAQQAYASAASIAESDPSVHRAAAQASVLGMSWDLFAGDDLEAQRTRGLEHTDRALTADPADARSWLWKARLHHLAARDLSLRSLDPKAELAATVAAAERAGQLLDEPSEAHRLLGTAHWAWAQWLHRRGEDPRPRIATAIAELERVPEEKRDYSYFNALGLALMTAGDHRARRGEGASETYRRAIDAYQAAIDLHSAPLGALHNLGMCLFKQSAEDEIADPLALLHSAIEAFEAASAIEPDHLAPHYYLGQSYLRLAQGGKAASGKLGEEVDKAITHYERAHAINPGMAQLHSSLGEARYLQALAAWDRGSESDPLFRQARASYGRGLELAPENEVLHQNLAWVAYFEGKYRVRQGQDPAGLLDEAIERSSRALELSTQPGALLCLGSAYRMKAEHDFLTERTPVLNLEAAQRAFDRLLELNPRYAEAYRSLGRLHTLEARWRHLQTGPAEESLERGRRALDRALEMDPGIAFFWLADARWWHQRAKLSRQAEPAKAEAADRGLVSVRRALTLRPEWAEAQALGAILLDLQATAREPPNLQDRAVADQQLREALAANPHLSFEWGEELLTQ